MKSMPQMSSLDTAQQKAAMQQSAADGDSNHTARAFVLTIRHVSSVATQATQLNQPRSEHVLIRALSSNPEAKAHSPRNVK